MTPLSKSRESASKAVFAMLQLLKKEGGQLPAKEVFEKLRQTLTFTPWEQEIYSKTGNVRWESNLHFFTIDCIKAGFMTKHNGIWYITIEGEKALALGPVKLLEEATSRYRKWAAVNKPKKQKEEPELAELPEDENQLQKANLEQLEEQALGGLKEFVNDKNPYEFQNLVAALLRAMGYHTPFISPRGKDGGIDIIAFPDPLGATEPRIKVQVKHKPDSVIPVDDIRSLLGLLSKGGDIGLFVTSGRFTNESERFARESHVHVRLIDINSFISLWKDYYHKLSDEEKNLLPLHPVYFLGVNE